MDQKELKGTKGNGLKGTKRKKNGLRGNKRNELKGTKRVKECKVVTRHICCRPLEWACYGKNGKNAKKRLRPQRTRPFVSRQGLHFRIQAGLLFWAPAHGRCWTLNPKSNKHRIMGKERHERWSPPTLPVWCKVQFGWLLKVFELLPI